MLGGIPSQTIVRGTVELSKADDGELENAACDQELQAAVLGELVRRYPEGPEGIYAKTVTRAAWRLSKSSETQANARSWIQGWKDPWNKTELLGGGRCKFRPVDRAYGEHADYVTLDVACAALGVSRLTVESIFKQGGLYEARVSGGWREDETRGSEYTRAYEWCAYTHPGLPGVEVCWSQCAGISMKSDAGEIRGVEYLEGSLSW